MQLARHVLSLDEADVDSKCLKSYCKTSEKSMAAFKFQVRTPTLYHVSHATARRDTANSRGPIKSYGMVDGCVLFKVPRDEC
jgi:hypothetical protein